LIVEEVVKVVDFDFWIYTWFSVHIMIGLIKIRITFVKISQFIIRRFLILLLLILILNRNNFPFYLFLGKVKWINIHFLLFLILFLLIGF
jgi:hypothetical protein